MNLRVSEMVSSIQGEGRFTGYPTTFVRLYGCNLKCTYCDTNCTSKRRRSIDNLLTDIFNMKNRHICITGGEPLLQESVYALIYELVTRDYIVNIETNGSIKIEDYTYTRGFTYTMDIKCPSSGMSTKNLYKNLGILQSHDEVKFVISDAEDYEFAKEIVKTYPTKANLIFSPCFDKEGKSNATWLAESLIEDKIPRARLGLQIHKLIGVY